MTFTDFPFATEIKCIISFFSFYSSRLNVKIEALQLELQRSFPDIRRYAIQLEFPKFFASNFQASG